MEWTINPLNYSINKSFLKLEKILLEKKYLSKIEEPSYGTF
jgi:hypothetical protein